MLMPSSLCLPPVECSRGTQSHPRCKLTTLAKRSAVSDCGDERSGREGADPRDRVQALAGFVLLCGSVNQPVDLLQVPSQLLQFLLQLRKQQAHRTG